MIEKELKRYFEGIAIIKYAVGGIYAGRIPSNAKDRESIVIRRISTDRTYGQFGEDTVAMPTLQIVLISQNEASSTVLHALFENCRKAINEFAKAPGKMGDVYVYSARIVSEGVDLIASSVSTWKRQRSFDVEIMHEQEVEFV